MNIQNSKPAKVHFPLLYEMIRSFTTLARQLNLSRAVEELNSTRQTVRRHISQLEETFGAPLFSVVDRRYELTQAGLDALPEALDIQARASAWINGQLASVDQLQILNHEEGDWDFYQQQHPVGRVFSDDVPLLREGLRAWAMSGGRIEHPLMQHIRPFLIIYRESPVGWVCVEFGQRSFYTNWYGEELARSSIGKPLGGMPGGDDFARMLDQAFKDVIVTESSRLDHVATKFPRLDAPGLHPAAYQRLMMAGYFPDQSLAVLTLVMPTTCVDIRGMPPGKLENMTNLQPVDFDLSESKFENFEIS